MESVLQQAERHSGSEPELGEPGFGGWFAFWGSLAVLALLAVAGAAFAAGDAAPGDYACGMILLLAAIALAFLLVRRRFDGRIVDWGALLLVDDMANLIAVIVVFVLLGLAGLFVAAAVPAGALHPGGIALFLACAVGIFLQMKRVFDNFVRQNRG